jgi:hypothetical protein
MRCYLAILALLSLPLPSPAQTLQLADGQLLLATVEAANEDGLSVRRLDNGGVLDLRWDHLAPASALKIKQAHALAGTDEQELMVTAYEVRYFRNGQPQTIIGRIHDADRSGGELVVQLKGGQTTRIPIVDLAPLRKIEVPALQVYTKDEFYREREQLHAPGDSADKHMLLAEDLIRVRDYEHARQHLDRARELGNSKAPQQLQSMLERMQLYVAAAKERELLDQIQIARTRGTVAELQKGEKWIAQYERDFPQSKLKAEFEAEKKRFADTRKRIYSQQVAEAWRRGVQTLADKKVQEPGIKLQDVREYAEQKMGAEIAEAVAARLGLQLEEIRQLFADRAKYPVGRRAEPFSYGIGSWVLGEAAIVKGTKQGEADKAPKDEAQERDLERIARLIRKAMEQRRNAAQGGAGQDHEQTEEEWWTDSSRQERAGWLRAYYAEFGGDLVVTAAFTQPCFTCFGTGTTSALGQGGKVEKVKCYLCHGFKWMRSFKAY